MNRVKSIEHLTPSEVRKEENSHDDTASESNRKINFHLQPDCYLEDIESSPKKLQQSVIDNLKDFDRL